MLTVLPRTIRCLPLGALAWLCTRARAALDELRRGLRASRRHDELRDALARGSCLDISRQVAREVYGDRLPALSGRAVTARESHGL